MKASRPSKTPEPVAAVPEMPLAVAALPPRWYLPLVLVAYCLMAGWYALVTPLQDFTLPDSVPQTAGANATIRAGLGPDEKEYYLYIRSLAEQGRPPVARLSDHPAPDRYVCYQAQHPPLAFALMALLYRLLGRPEGAFWWTLLRGFCVLCGVFVVCLVDRAARVAFPARSAFTWGAAPFAAFVPVFTGLCANFSNEPLALALGAWAWLQMVRLFRADTPPTLRQAVVLALTLGLAGLTRLTSVLWLPAAFAALIYPHRREWGQAIKPLAAFALTYAVVLSPWVIYCLANYGTLVLRSFSNPLLHDGATLADFLRSGVPSRELPLPGNPTNLALLFAATAWTPWIIFRYLPGGFALLQLWCVPALLMVVFVLLALFWNTSQTRRNLPGPPHDPAGRALLWAGGLSLGFCVLILIQQVLYVDFRVFLSAGRYAVAALPASTFLLAAALDGIWRRKSAPRQVAKIAVLAAALCFYDGYVASLTGQYYAQFPTQPAYQRIAHDGENGPYVLSDVPFAPEQTRR